jgi:hypothetical protein
MALAIGSYLKLVQANGQNTGYAFQNFHQGETRTYEFDSYIFASFGFSGGAIDLQAGSISASLVFSLNQLSLSVFQEAANEFWLAQVRTVWLDPETLNETNQFSEELYSVLGLDHDTSRIQVRLGNPLDAIQQNVPRRVLTQSAVGAMPSTGNLSLQ